MHLTAVNHTKHKDSVRISGKKSCLYTMWYRTIAQFLADRRSSISTCTSAITNSSILNQYLAHLYIYRHTVDPWLSPLYIFLLSTIAAASHYFGPVRSFSCFHQRLSLSASATRSTRINPFVDIVNAQPPAAHGTALSIRYRQVLDTFRYSIPH